MKTVVMPTLQVFSGPQEAAMLEELEAAAGRDTPITCLGLQAQMAESGWKATTMNRYAIFEATGDRADKLKADHEKLAALSDPVMPFGSRKLGRSPTEAECPPMKIHKVGTADAD